MTTTRGTIQSFCLVLIRPLKQRRFTRKRAAQAFCRRTRPFTLFLLVTVFLVYNLHAAYKRYHCAVFTIPPRRSHVDRSLDFRPPDPLPRLFSRHTTPWRKYPDLQLGVASAALTPSQSNHRYLVSSADEDVGDGLGHRFLVVNYERRLADALNLTYVHRVARYGSITAFYPDAVDHFFGWEGAEDSWLTRESLFKRVCAKRGRRMLTMDCVEKMIFCKKLRLNNGLVDNIVHIPDEVALCLKYASGKSKCWEALQAFTRKHTRPNTMFFTPIRFSSWKLFWSDQRITRSWFFDRYWSQPRKSRMDPRFVNIAIHVRRGDFLKFPNRLTIPDMAYARIVRRIASIVSEEEQDDIVGSKREPMDLKFKVHIYSQGLFQPQTSHPVIRYLAGKGLLGFHNVNDYGTKYVSENGVETSEGYWDRMLGNHPRISCDLHVSEDTLEGLEQMIAADILVGSASALSVHIGAQLSRGIPFLPVRPPGSATSNKTIRWDPQGTHVLGADRLKSGLDNSFFDEQVFRRVWQEYRQHIGADETPFGIPQSFTV